MFNIYRTRRCAEHGCVLAAGNFSVDGAGVIRWAASNSGHYRVLDEMCSHNLCTALMAHGYSVRTYRFLRYKECLDFQTDKKKTMKPSGRGRPARNNVVDLIKETLRVIAGVKRAERLRQAEVARQLEIATGPVIGNKAVFDSIDNDSL